MTDTRTLLNRIAAVRTRLGQAQIVLHDSEAAATKVSGRTKRLDRKTKATSRSQRLLDDSLRQLSRQQPELSVTAKPLSSRARRCLERCRDTIAQLRMLHEFHPGEFNSPIAACHQRCAAMAETVVRTAQAMPDSTSEQVRVCEGLEGFLDSIDQQSARLNEAINRKHRTQDWIERLSHAFSVLSNGDMHAFDLFLDIAAAIDTDVMCGRALNILSPGAISPAASTEACRAWQLRLLATHAINTAQVAARVARNFGDWSDNSLRPVVAALLHDVGLTQVPMAILTQSGSLSVEQRHAIESHVARSAEIVTRQIPGAANLSEAIRQHHEQLDGTGYPEAMKSPSELARLLAVCDSYAAMLAPRPHRQAIDPRSALTEIMLFAQRGRLDRDVVASLQQLGFYPPGAVVELNTGRVGIVVASHVDAREPQLPAQPIIALLTDADGECLPQPACIDLSVDTTSSIRCALSHTERCERIGSHYPQLV